MKYYFYGVWGTMLKDFTLGQLADVMEKKTDACLVEPVSCWDLDEGDVIFIGGKWWEYVRSSSYKMKKNNNCYVRNIGDKDGYSTCYLIPFGRNVLRRIKPKKSNIS